ncbi:endonuclease V [Methanolobus halotolerans]|uniref:Endonuclease V n=1 Tax=Methanolobus halotolerans TaxID=2052935 RepID=A0A4E0PY87_9EURY|nr:endonuclease V [Methanolobus halotolerans]TGC09830.1 deoxyribonuclease V [Methanolobus halotolerans]
MNKDRLREWFDPQKRSLKELRELQHRAVERIDLEDGFDRIETVAGMDCSYIDKNIICAMVILDYATMEVIEKRHAIQEVGLPYIPTYLNFREGCAMASVFLQVSTRPDITIFDSCGINHPIRAGMAAYFGAVMDVPTVGVSKKILCGHAITPVNTGEYHELMQYEEQIGWVLKSNKKSNPIIIAPGNKVSMGSCLEVVQHCLKGYKLPEPTRLAHNYAGEIREELRRKTEESA